MRCAALLLLPVLALAEALPAQEPAPVVACRFCGSRGQRDCDRHGGGLLELEAAAAQCSVAASCPKCAGALTVDCKICSNPAAEQAAAARREAAARWLAERRAEVSGHVKDEALVLGQSAHVDLALSLRPLTVGRTKLDTHRLMHLYLERIEALRARFLEVLELGEKDLSARLRIYMLGDCADHQRLAPRVAGGGSNSVSMKLMGVEAVYSMCQERRVMRDDEDVHRNVVHNVAHLLISNMKPEVWLGNRKHGWIDAGVAHWFEDLVTGKCTNFCYEEVGVTGGFKGGRWRVPIRRSVEAGALVPFATVSALNTDQLEGQHHAQVFAYIDFLIATRGGGRLANLVRLLKEGQSTRDALPAAVELSMLGFDEEFGAWVEAHYPLQER